MPEPAPEYRAKFQNGQQQVWIASLPLSVSEIATVCSCSERTVRDWRRERFLMDYACIEKLCVATNTSLPDVHRIPRYAHARTAGRKGGAAVVRKYGRVPVDESIRKERWRQWWETTGKYKNGGILVPKSIYKPRKNAKLAEFIGIMLGDGGISNAQLTVTLHSHDDREYGAYVSQLIQTLFATPVSIRPRRDSRATGYVVSRRELVLFCTNELGLKKGNKVTQQVDIPEWVKANRRFVIACIRGLIDTDGCVLTHSYKVQGKQYRYKKIVFTNRSKPLLDSVYTLLMQLGIRTRHTHQDDLWLDSRESVEQYMRIVGSNNPKHLKRYAK